MGGSMIKKFFLSLAFLAGLLSPVYSAGTISLSLTQRLDNVTWKPLNGGKLYFFRAGTTTPQNAYQDSALTIPHPNPLTLDSGGNIPQLFFADGQIKFRLTNASGVNQLAADNILVVGPSSGGGGGGGTVDPTTIMQPGFIAPYYGTGVRTGFVRANGRTIGSATSGATERANSDCQTLFEYLWGTDANLVVSTGRGASANADWVANKTIVLPDWRGQALGALADMGNSATTLLTSTYFGTDPTVLGAAGGTQSKTLLTANLPPYTPTGSVAVSGTATGTGKIDAAGTGSIRVLSLATGPVSDGWLLQLSATGSFTGTAQGGASTPFSAVSPLKLATIYLKL